MCGSSGRVLSPLLLQSHSILVGTLRAKMGIWQVNAGHSGQVLIETFILMRLAMTVGAIDAIGILGTDGKSASGDLMFHRVVAVDTEKAALPIWTSTSGEGLSREVSRSPCLTASPPPRSCGSARSFPVWGSRRSGQPLTDPRFFRGGRRGL